MWAGRGMRLHLHRDRDFQVEGANAYYECRCGARRTVHWYRNMLSPVRAGWPRLVDRHNCPIRDSGWVKIARVEGTGE